MEVLHIILELIVIMHEAEARGTFTQAQVWLRRILGR